MIQGLFAVADHESPKMRGLLSGTVVAQGTAGGRAGTLKKFMKIECILCPTDLSPDSDEALRYAIGLARGYNAELILLHCDLTAGGLATPNAHDEAAQAIRRSARGTLGCDWSRWTRLEKSGRHK